MNIIEAIKSRLSSASQSDRMYERPMTWEEADELIAALEAVKAELDRQHTLHDNLNRKYEGVCAKLELAEAALRDLEAKEPRS